MALTPVSGGHGLPAIPRPGAGRGTPAAGSVDGVRFAVPQGQRGAVARRPRRQQLFEQTLSFRGVRTRRGKGGAHEAHGEAAVAEQERQLLLQGGHGRDAGDGGALKDGARAGPQRSRDGWFEWLSRPPGRAVPPSPDLQSPALDPPTAQAAPGAWNFDAGPYRRWVSQHRLPAHPAISLPLFSRVDRTMAARQAEPVARLFAGASGQAVPARRPEGPVGDTLLRLLRGMGSSRDGLRSALGGVVALLRGHVALHGCWFHQGRLHAAGSTPWRAGTRFFGWLLL